MQTPYEVHIVFRPEHAQKIKTLCAENDWGYSVIVGDIEMGTDIKLVYCTTRAETLNEAFKKKNNFLEILFANNLKPVRAKTEITLEDTFYGIA